MNQTERARLTADEVLRRIRAELAEPSERSSALAARIAQLRTMQRDFRDDPVGGRLSFLKKIAFWFTASAFDRQGKVIEALFDVVDDMAAELDQLDRLITEIGRDKD